jgi:hypothetical protein
MNWNRRIETRLPDRWHQKRNSLRPLHFPWKNAIWKPSYGRRCSVGHLCGFLQRKIELTTSHRYWHLVLHLTNACSTVLSTYMLLPELVALCSGFKPEGVASEVYRKPETDSYQSRIETDRSGLRGSLFQRESTRTQSRHYPGANPVSATGCSCGPLQAVWAPTKHYLVYC